MVNIARYQFTKVWIDARAEVPTRLTPVEATRRLRLERHEIGDMVVLIRPRRRTEGYVMVATRRGRSNSYQRCFYCTLGPDDRGVTTLRGVIRTRPWARFHLNGGLAFLSLWFVVVMLAALSRLLAGQADAALALAGWSLLAVAMAAVTLGIVNFSMAITAQSETYLLGWLKEHLA
jgi:hypothetical protein